MASDDQIHGLGEALKQTGVADQQSHCLLGTIGRHLLRIDIC